jgi:hypothetical protein
VVLRIRKVSFIKVISSDNHGGSKASERGNESFYVRFGFDKENNIYFYNGQNRIKLMISKSTLSTLNIMQTQEYGS